jgi:hypothetical protein
LNELKEFVVKANLLTPETVCAYIKLKGLKLETKTTPVALKSKLYLSALKTAYAELVKLNPQPFAA